MTQDKPTPAREPGSIWCDSCPCGENILVPIEAERIDEDRLTLLLSTPEFVAFIEKHATHGECFFELSKQIPGKNRPMPEARAPGFHWLRRNREWLVAHVDIDGEFTVQGSADRWLQLGVEPLLGTTARGVFEGEWGDRIPTPTAKPAQTEADKLLALARKCDETADLEAKLVAGEELRLLLGDRYDAFDNAYEAVVLATPDFPRAAEFVLCFVVQMAPACDEMRDALLRWVMLGTAKMLTGAVSTKRQRDAAEQVQGVSDATSDSDAAQILGGFFLALLLDPPGLVPADAVKVWLEVATEALQGEPTDWESALRSLVEMMQERLPAQARAE